MGEGGLAALGLFVVNTTLGPYGDITVSGSCERAPRR
jgi:hypothetical protein